MPVLPIGFKIVERLPCQPQNRFRSYQLYILFFTFFAYTSYHLSRKPISVVKSVLHRNCSAIAEQLHINITKDNDTFCSWAPFENDNTYSQLLGTLEYAYLLSYAFAMLVSGHIAERLNLRHYLGVGMILSGLTTAMFGLGYYLNIHNIEYYIFVQIAGGVVQATGWPSVVTLVGNWFAKGRRGLIMGVWNSHTSVGNILGSFIAGFFVSTSWGLSFIIPGFIIAFLGVLVLLFLVPYPNDIGLPSPHDFISEPLSGDDSGARSCVDSVEDIAGTCDFSNSSNNEDLVSSQSGVVTSDYDSMNNHSLPQDQKSTLKSVTSNTPLIQSDVGETPHSELKAVSLLTALRIPGVVEFSLCLFFAKLVSYTFLYWLPNYLKHATGLKPDDAAYLSTLFDFGGILGGILAGLISDNNGKRATTCMLMLLLAAPMLLIFNIYGSVSLPVSVTLLLVTGVLVNGPYALITTAVSADLGTSKSLQGNSKALATVTAIIDGTGSMGAALGPFLTGLISPYGWSNVFYMLIAADLLAFTVSLNLSIKHENLTRKSLSQIKSVKPRQLYMSAILLTTSITILYLIS